MPNSSAPKDPMTLATARCPEPSFAGVMYRKTVARCTTAQCGAGIASGKLEGKEYYLNGDAAGVWPSYYENGNMSSLGDWENGAKRGLWKYWNNGGKLLTEVAYSVDGNFQTDYYVSGQKKATGTFTPTGKTGKWIYWSRDGKEIARCDFGRGQFSLSTPGCRTIATELEPKGFSPPIPAGSKNPDGTLQLSVGTKLFKFSAPQGWIADMKAGHEEDLPIVFYPENKEWKAAGANMYIRAFFKKGRSFTRTIEEDQQAFEENVAEVHKQPDASGQLSGGFNYVSKSIHIQTDDRNRFAFLDRGVKPDIRAECVYRCIGKDRSTTRLNCRQRATIATIHDRLSNAIEVGSLIRYAFIKNPPRFDTLTPRC